MKRTLFPSSVRRASYPLTRREKVLILAAAVLVACVLLALAVAPAPAKQALLLPPYCNGLRSTAAAACSHCMAENCSWASTEYGQQVCGDRHSCRAD